ncbi:hypothetical protein [Actinomycetospora atypica]|uniref:RNA polymerase sigma factor 70 region 4 type 2 domain-containing protein n=1 Tax=Actinomycetospora atypica TaxID=1290095 RepID=A0ABV9YIS8_9PSEU
MVDVLHRLVLGNDVGEAAGKLGRPVRLTPAEHARLQEDGHLRESLVDDAVIACLELFEVRLRKGVAWREDGGAGLTTYLVNGSVLAFVDRLRIWRRTRAEELLCSPVDPARIAAGLADPDDVTDYPDRLDDVADAIALLHEKDPLVVTAMTWRVDTDESWQVIAGRLGVTPKALERRLARARAYLRRQRERRDGRA